ncbi:uncharacterized protein RCC_01383 [Ramularia collo-cygni]|uniref:Uncharacterized protein n=1 Tax=Ramularia collo-cygni TaxID=112498 RepID=A0A2D3UWQ8_9PEZI|nr:uncharacterized protein RCC_01383 [Ramularia collo-cygni]CZT15526.1 uncharacterized protein RCC_01383 [Ramularia collo-cygni]
MLNIQLLTLAALSATAIADLNWYGDNGCGNDYLSGSTFNCGLGCTAFTDFKGEPTNNVHSVEGLVLEPNTQVLLYKSADCSGDPYSAIGQSYGSPVPENQCVPSSKDGLGSFQVVVYSDKSGGEACPPGTMTAASSKYPAPTG